MGFLNPNVYSVSLKRIAVFRLKDRGRDCKVRIDNCAGVVCNNRGVCVDGYDSHHCEDAPTSMYARAFKDMGSCGRGDG